MPEKHHLYTVKFGKKRVFLVGTINFMTITAEVATSKFKGTYLSNLKEIQKHGKLWAQIMRSSPPTEPDFEQ